MATHTPAAPTVTAGALVVKCSCATGFSLPGEDLTSSPLPQLVAHIADHAVKANQGLYG